jgi:hypothetical protein
MLDRLHSRSRLLVLCFTVTSLLVLTTVPPHSRARAANALDAAPVARPVVGPSAQAGVRAAYGKLPMRFERNQGQFDPRVRFAARGAGYNLWLTASEAVLSLQSGSPRASRPSLGIRGDQPPRESADNPRAALIRMKLVNANPKVAMHGEEELAGRTNSFIGNDAHRWQTDIKNYAKVRAEQVYRGIGLLYYGNGRELEYDFDVAAGADPARIRMRYEGAQALRVDAAGDLIVRTAAGEVRQHRPVAFQQDADGRRDVAVTYVLRGKDEVRFALGAYDHHRPLVIDPVLVYSTYLGGSNNSDEARAIAVDVAGNAYVTGDTWSSDFPLVNSIGTYAANTRLVFVSKLNASGNGLIYSTYISGTPNGFTSQSYGLGIAVDSAGNAYVTGETTATNFPTTPGAFQTVKGQNPRGGANDAFILKLSATGAALVYSTYLGGGSDDYGRAIAIDGIGNAYITGATSSADFPKVNPMQATLGQYQDAFVTKLNATGTALIYSTLLGGNNVDAGDGLAIDAAGNVYVTGSTFSTDFPTVNAIQTDFRGRGAFSSTDGGASWLPTGNAFPITGTIRSIAIDPSNASVLYVGTGCNGIFKSTNGGGTWVAINSGLPDQTEIGHPGFYDAVYDLEIDRTNPAIIYAGSGSGLFMSTNGGGSWSYRVGVYMTSVKIDPSNSKVIYAADIAYGLHRSTDGGKTWNNNFGGIGVATSTNVIAIAPTEPPTVYVNRSDVGVYRLTSSGFAVLLLNFGGGQAMAVDPQTPTTVYASTSYGGVYKSTNGGDNWTLLNNGTLLSTILSLTIDPQTPTTLYAGTYAGLYRSLDGGGSWTPVSAGLPDMALYDVAVGPPSERLYAIGETPYDVFVSKLNADGSSLAYSTYFGGLGKDGGTDLALDAANNVYVTGLTYSTDIQNVNSLRLFGGSSDAFVLKLNSAGALAYFSYLGGGGLDYANAITVDAAGNASVTGRAGTLDFPTTPDAIPLAGPPCANCVQAFVTTLSADGTTLLYSTYLGGNTPDPSFATPYLGEGFAITADASGHLYVAGLTYATDFPVTAGAFDPVYNRWGDAFVTKLALPCTINLSANELAFLAQGGNGRVNVSASLGCPWQAASNDSWIVLTSGGSGSGNGSVMFQVLSNPADRFREGSLSIGGQTVRVRQAGLANECRIQLNPTYASYSAAGGSGATDVLADYGCVWMAHTDYDWITITSGDNGQGSGRLSYRVAANPNRTARVGAIIIGDRSFAIKQKGR